MSQVTVTLSKAEAIALKRLAEAVDRKIRSGKPGFAIELGLTQDQGFELLGAAQAIEDALS